MKMTNEQRKHNVLLLLEEFWDMGFVRGGDETRLHILETNEETEYPTFDEYLNRNTVKHLIKQILNVDLFEDEKKI